MRNYSKIPTVVTTEQPRNIDQVSAVRNAPTSAFPVRGTTKQKWYRSRKSWIMIPAAAILIFFVLLQSKGALASQILSFLHFSVPEGMQPQFVTVRHVPGILVSDNTKTRIINTQSQLSNMLQWQENGIDYVITGSIDGYTMNTSQLLTVANSLH